MRWSFGPPHLTLKPSKKKKKPKNKKRRKKEKNWKNTKNKKKAFQLSVNLFLFLVGVQNFPFLTPWPKKRAPKKAL